MDDNVFTEVRDLLEAEGIDCSVLDDLVHDCASEVASSTNNEGMGAQLKYLLEHGWTGDDIVFQARQARDDAAEEQRRDEKHGLYADKIDVAN